MGVTVLSGGGGTASAAAVVARVTRSAAFSVANATLTVVPFDVEVIDPDGFHDAVNTTRLTVPVGQGGKYLAGATMRWGPHTTGQRQTFLTKNGLTNHGYDLRPGGGSVTVNTVLVPLELVDGDYLEAKVHQDSGAALDVQLNDGGEISPMFWLVRLGD